MASVLNEGMVDSGGDVFHTPEFLAYVQSHESLLKRYSVVTELDPGMVHKLEYNFMSLLIELRYPVENIMFFMVANDIEDPTQFTGDTKSIVLPSVEVMDRLKNLYLQRPGRI